MIMKLVSFIFIDNDVGDANYQGFCSMINDENNLRDDQKLINQFHNLLFLLQNIHNTSVCMVSLVNIENKIYFPAEVKYRKFEHLKKAQRQLFIDTCK